MPLPNHRIVHPRFQQAWQPTIQATMRATVRLSRLGNPQGVRDPATGRTTFPTPTPVYEGCGRVQVRSGGSLTPVADRQVTVGAYLVALPAAVRDVRVDDVVEVLACPDDEALQGLTLVVRDVGHADVVLQRNVGCDLHQPTIRG